MENMVGKNKLSVREMCQIGIFVAIVAVCAQIAIPQPSGVPFTLQAWAIALAGIVLGAKKGALVAIIYVALGIVGAPVFVGFSGGVGMLVHPTGGFLFSFPILAFFAGLGSGKGAVFFNYIGIAVGAVANFVCGMLYFSFITSLSLQISFMYAVAPFIIPTAIKIALVPTLGSSIKMALTKAQVQV